MMRKNKLIKRLTVKIAILGLLLCLTIPHQSGALFTDQENSSNNIFKASSLDLSFTIDDNSPAPFTPGEVATASAYVKNVGNLPFSYDLSYQFATGSSQLCQSLQLKVNQDATSIYQGLLADFLVYPFSLDPSTLEKTYNLAFSLPPDPSLDLINKTCQFKIISHAWQQDNPTYGTGFWDQEDILITINTGTWEAAPVCTTLDGYVFKDDQTPLANWDVIIHQSSPSGVIDVLTIPTTEAFIATSSAILENNNYYLIEATGQNANKLLVNETPVNWGTDNSSNLYKLPLPGDNEKLTLSFVDDNYQDNTNDITIHIYDVTSEIVHTNNNGYYSKEICNPDPYQILQIIKPGFSQITPTNPSYYHLASSYNFINHLDSNNPLVINEVYYDVNLGSETGAQNDEWVELYNSTNMPINLKNWTIEDDGPSRTISHSNRFIPAHGFAVIAKNAQTWTYWTIPDNAIKIPLGQEIGNGLSNDGDRLILKNNNNQIIDQISWGTDTTILNPSITDVAEGHSIARNPVGHDTDQASDFDNLITPNPGTNPHSHIQPKIIRDGQKLIIGFEHASGFDHLKYTVSYTHQFEDQTITEQIAGEADKPSDNVSFALSPIYLGTCSSLGQVCVPHENISDIVVSLLYQTQGEILGTSEHAL